MPNQQLRLVPLSDVFSELKINATEFIVHGFLSGDTSSVTLYYKVPVGKTICGIQPGSDLNRDCLGIAKTIIEQRPTVSYLTISSASQKELAASCTCTQRVFDSGLALSESDGQAYLTEVRPKESFVFGFYSKEAEENNSSTRPPIGLNPPISARIPVEAVHISLTGGELFVSEAHRSQIERKIKDHDSLSRLGVIYPFLKTISEGCEKFSKSFDRAEAVQFLQNNRLSKSNSKLMAHILNPEQERKFKADIPGYKHTKETQYVLEKYPTLTLPAAIIFVLCQKLDTNEFSIDTSSCVKFLEDAGFSQKINAAIQYNLK